jgi:hypothetical protein
MSLIEVTDFSEGGWKDPATRESRSRWCCERLEHGDILLLPRFAVVSEEEQRFLLGARQKGSAFVKNISYEPASGSLRGYAQSGADARRLKQVLSDYSDRIHRAAAQMLMPYALRLQADFTSFRPLEEQGRRLRRRSRNDLIHVDSFPTRPALGRRLLRFFTNVHPAKPRVWVVSQSFEELATRMALDAGLAQCAAGPPEGGRRLRPALAVAARLIGIRVVERSPYDRFMLRFHNYLKANQSFQRDCPKQQHEFLPGATWLAFTDMVAHGVLSGQYALEQTFFLPVSSTLRPDKSPLGILQSIAGLPLA